MKFVSYFSLLIALSLVLIGCGSSTPPRPDKIVKVCSGLTDKCHTVDLSKLKAVRGPSGNRFPDVSSYQGCVDWGRVHAAGYNAAAIKEGEYQQDPTFDCNVAGLKANHMFWAPYWFVHSDPVGEANQIVADVRAVGGLTSGPVVLDVEVGNAANSAPTMDRIIYAAFHRHAVIYTAPGTWPGGSGFGSLPLWQATYGSSFNPFWHPVVAWQYTDGAFGSPTYVPGIGYGDMNIDYGFTKNVNNPVPPRVHCFGPHAQVRNAHCRVVRPELYRRGAELRHISNVSYWHYNCLKRYRRPGVNYHRGFCIRLRNIAAADQKYIAANLY